MKESQEANAENAALNIKLLSFVVLQASVQRLSPILAVSSGCRSMGNWVMAITSPDLLGT